MFFYVLLLDYSMFSITLPLEEPEQTADICRESPLSDRGVDVDVEPPVPRNKNNFSSWFWEQLRRLQITMRNTFRTLIAREILVIAPAGFGPEAKPEEASLESPRVMTWCSVFGEIIP